MATPAFGDPEYQSAPDEHVDAPHQAIDPNDPALTSEVLTEDVTADAFAVPPPPPDGKWRAKLKLADIKNAQGQMVHFMPVRYEKMNDGKAYYVVNVEASLIDVTGKFDGVKVTQYHVKSAVDRRKNVSEMTTITKAATGTASDRGTQSDRVTALEKALAGEPEVVIETLWRAACQTCQDRAKKAGEKKPGDFILGQHRFPQPKPGVFDPLVQCPTCKSMCRAQLKIGGFFNSKEVKATRGIA